MPVELKNIKGGGLHYVAYNTIYLVIFSPQKLNFSELVWNTTAPMKKDSSKELVSLLIMTSMTLSTTKEYLRLD